MNILVIGSGGREHALAWKCAQDNFVNHVYVCPGNAGTFLEDKVSNVNLDTNDYKSIEDFCLEESIELVIIGPEQPLVEGLTDPFKGSFEHVDELINNCETVIELIERVSEPN